MVGGAASAEEEAAAVEKDVRARPRLYLILRMLFDLMDGRVARMTKTQSAFDCALTKTQAGSEQ